MGASACKGEDEVSPARFRAASGEISVVESIGNGSTGKALKALPGSPASRKQKKTRGVVLSGAAPVERRNQAMCPNGHPMRARVVKEIFMCCTPCQADIFCGECGRDIPTEDAYYECKKCVDYHMCVACAREALGLPIHHEDGGPPLLEVDVGDIFLCGPDKNGIHHVVLARGPLEPAGADIAEHFDLEPGVELYSCQTIESTQGSVGEQTWWYPTETFFQRDPFRGTAALVADLPPGSTCLEKAMEPVPFKVLLHPLRPGRNDGIELDEEVFEEVIEEAAKESQRYGKRTAVKSFLKSAAHMGVIERADYASPQDLVDKLKKSWDNRPICASVAIKVWQKYFQAVCDTPEEMVDSILEVMPHWCHRSTPSLMVKTLTAHGWVLVENLDG